MIITGREINQRRLMLYSLQEDVAKNLLAEFNLGCRGSDVDHKYRIYVATFLGFGGNEARARYEKLLIASAAKDVKPTYLDGNQGLGQGDAFKKGNGTGTEYGDNRNMLMPTPTLQEPAGCVTFNLSIRILSFYSTCIHTLIFYEDFSSEFYVRKRNS